MARLRCHACGLECETPYRGGTPECPECGSRDVQVAIAVRELPYDDPFWTALAGEEPAAVDLKYRRLQ